MKKNEPISKVMTTDVVTVHVGDPVSKVRQLMEGGSIQHVPVVDGGRLVGIISWNDLLRVTYGDLDSQDPRGLDAMLDHSYTLDELMKEDPVTVNMKTATVRDAAVILGDRDFHSLPVVDEGGQLAGIVTSSDLIRFLADLF